MEFLGIGPLELVFIVLIALVLLGPVDMLKAAQTIGRTLRKLITSEGWRDIQRSMNTLRDLPTSMMREAGLEEDLRTINDAARVQIPAADLGISKPSDSPETPENPPAEQESDAPLLIQTPPHPPEITMEDDESQTPGDGEDHPASDPEDDPESRPA